MYSSSREGAAPIEGSPLGLACVGLSHHTSPLELREAIALSEDETAGAVRRLREASVEEALVLSTCNRTEFYTRAHAALDTREVVRDVVLSLKGIDISRLDGALYVRRDPETVRHLFRVACGLDSMVLGEPQILGQVKHAAEIASQAGGAGLVTGKMIEIALSLGKRARSETGIGEGAVSVASAGVDLARKVFGSLRARRVLILGAGGTARLAAERLKEAGVADFAIANRTAERAHALAAAVGGVALDLARADERLAWADLVLTATASPRALITARAVSDALRSRGGRRLVFLDLSVPRDVEVEVNDLANVFVHDLDTLRTIVDATLDQRRREAPRVERIVEDGVERFLRWHGSLGVTPTLTAFRERVEAIRDAEILRHRARFREEDLPAIEALTRSIVQKILHSPTSRLRESAHEHLGPARVDALRHLFDLDDGAGPAKKPGEGHSEKTGGDDSTRDPR
jgi:glutamyl-tRNA reductase